MSSPLLSRMLANSVAMTEKAAQIARDIMKSGELGIEQKTDINDLQTKADRSIQDCLASSFRANFPGINLVGEEGENLHGEVPADWIVKDFDAEAARMAVPDEFKNAELKDFTVWIDPLDGTKEYTEGFLDHVTILVGIAIGKKAVAGVINQPFYNYEKKDGNMGRTLYGIVGTGVHGIERCVPPADKRIVTTSRSHGTGLVNDTIACCKPTDEIRVGGAGHKVLLLIEGKAHAYVFPSPGCKKWDTCAPEAILHALGGKLTDIYGNHYEYHYGVGKVNEHGTLATCVLDHHAEYLGLIPDEYKDQVKDYFKKKAKK